MSIARIVLYTIVSFFGVVYLGGAALLTTVNHDRVVKGVTYMGRDISGLNESGVKKFFEQESQRKLDKINIIMQYGNQSWSIKKEDIGLITNAKDVANTAYNIGRSGDFAENFISQIKLLSKKNSVTMEGSYDKERLKNKLLEIKSAIDTEPVNATVTLHPNGMITKTDGIVGKSLDIEPIMAELDEKLKNLSEINVVVLKPNETQPYIKTSDVAAIDSVLASYTTSYYPGDRGDNIVLASSKLNDILIRKDETFSFNTSVGARTKSAGYKDAPVIVEGKVLEDVGGGVCQVSSTLYNAVLLAGLTPTVRTSHYFPSTYCPPGLDATVADDVLDFKFKNPLPHPVYIVSTAYGSQLTVYILGTKADLGGNTIALEQSGSRLTPTIHRLYIQNGTVVNREFMHTDYYDNP